MEISYTKLHSVSLLNLNESDKHISLLRHNHKKFYNAWTNVINLFMAAFMNVGNKLDCLAVWQAFPAFSTACE